MQLEDRCVGSLLGLALGDAFGAPYEGGILERALWGLIGRTYAGKRRYTDDTQMTLDLAQCLIQNRPLAQAEFACTLARNYRWSRGYGPGAAKTLRRIRQGNNWSVANRSTYRDGSLGNGAAIRVAPVALTYNSLDDIRSDALRSAEVTHAHPEAQECAWVIACVVNGLLENKNLNVTLCDAKARCTNDAVNSRLLLCIELLSQKALSPDVILAHFGNRVLARESTFCAIYLAGIGLDQPFESLLKNARSCGGDVDSIAAMAGAIWGAANGSSKLPKNLLEQLEAKAHIEQQAIKLYRIRQCCAYAEAKVG